MIELFLNVFQKKRKKQKMMIVKVHLIKTPCVNYQHLQNRRQK